MTRKQVATRMGRSVATVRRLEGVALFPTVDASGVHHFCPQEVDAVARGIVKSRRPVHFSLAATTATDDECSNCVNLERQLARVEAQIDKIRGEHAQELGALRDSNLLALAQLKEEQRELESSLAELLVALES